MKSQSCLAFGIVVGVLLATVATAQVVTSITVEEKDGVTTSNYPMTVSLLFAQGDVASNVTARVGAQNLTTQTDEKVAYADGSVKHALVSFVIPSVPANQSVTVDFVDGGTNANADWVTKTELLATDFEADMLLTIGGMPYSVSARSLLSGITTPEYWIQGDVCTEFLIRDFSTNIASQLNVQYYVRTYPGWSGFRVDAVVENCWTEYRGNLTYDFDLELGLSNPVSVFAKTGFTHNINARWHKVFWQGSEPPEVEVRYDLDYMIDTGLLPNYDTSLVMPETTLSSKYASWQSSSHDIMESTILFTYFPTTGGREDLGLYPGWAARYLLSMDNRMREIMLNCGDLSGSIPIHLRESDASRPSYTSVINIDDRPTVWSGWWDYTYQDPNDKLPAPIGTTSTEWTVDNAHQPSLACVPYLITGDFYYLEEMYFWGAWDLSNSNHSYRSDAQGLINDQTRGDAWAIRNVADPANLAPDVHTLEKSYFTEKANNNLTAWYNEYVVNGVYPSIRFWGVQSNIGADGGRPDSSLDSTVRYYTSPWMDDFVLLVLSHLDDIGFASDSLVDWLGASIINRFSHPDYNAYRGAPYHIPTHYNDGQDGGIVYSTWLDVNNAFVDNTGPSDFPNPDFASSYNYIARAAMSGVVHLTNGQTTWDWLDTNLYSAAALNEDPTWAMIPRGSTPPPSDTTAPAAVSDLGVSNPTTNSLDLAWTAPGDDGNTGTATSYDVRYSTSTITDANWASATAVSGEPSPALAGTAEGMTVSGLSADTTYYFAIKTSDEVPNVSALSNVPGGTTATVTLPSVQFDLTSSNGDESVVTVNLSVSLSASSASTVTVDYAVTGGTAVAPGDYSITGTQLTFNTGITQQDIVITVVDDGDVESDETIQVTLSNPSNATLGANTAHTYTINDNDVVSQPEVEFDLVSSSVGEETSSTSIEVTLSAASGDSVTVDYAVTGGTATETADFVMPASGSAAVALKRDAGLTAGGSLAAQFAALDSSDVVTTTVADALFGSAGDGRYMNYGASTTSAGGNGQMMVIWFDLSTYAGATINKAELRLHVTQGNTGVTWAPIKSHDWAEGNKNGAYPGSAPSAEGVCWAHPKGLYTAPSGALGWGTGSDQYFDTTGNGADLYGFTSFTSVPSGAAYLVADVTDTVDDWVSGAKSNFGLYIYVDNHSPDFSEAGTTVQPVLFVDYDLPGGQVVFQPGQTSKTIDVTLVDDGDVEGNETVELTLSNAVNADLGAKDVHTLTIVDDDVPAGPTVVALKRDAGLTAGGAVSAQFAALDSSDVVPTTVADALLGSAGNGRYMNYGASTTSAGGNGQKIVIWFDLSAYAGATINKAELRVHVTQGNSGVTWAPVKSHDWAEGNKDGTYPGSSPSAEGVCWAHPKGLYTAPSGALGWGTGSDQYFDATGNGADLYGFTSFTSVPGGVAYLVGDVTAVVADWVAGTKSNYGVYIEIGNHTPEFSEAGTAVQPVLFIEYE